MGTRIKNNNITLALGAATKCDLNSDILPNELEPKIQSIIDVTPNQNEFCDITKNNSAVNAVSAIIYTTPTNTDFYLTAANLSVIKDVTSTSTHSEITATIGGVSGAMLIGTVGITLTAQQTDVTQQWNIPIKIDRGTNIQVKNATNNANVTAQGVIQGYTVDPTIYNINP